MNSPALLCLTIFIGLILSSVTSQIPVKYIMKYAISIYISSSAGKKSSSLIQIFFINWLIV